MEAWAQEPGARVVGHRAVVVGEFGRLRVVCDCGFSTLDHGLAGACLVLVEHLQRAVRDGAEVRRGDDGSGGSAGVREPRRPLPPHDAAGAALDLR